MGFPGGPSNKEPACQCRRPKRCSFNPWVRKTPWRRAKQPTPVFLLKNPMDGGVCRLQNMGHKELDTTERLRTFIHQDSNYRL